MALSWLTNDESRVRVTFRFAIERRRSSARPYISSFLPRGDEDRWGSRGSQPKVFVVFRTSTTRDTHHHAGQGRSLHHAVDRQAYYRSITVTHTWKRRGRSDYSSWTYDHPVTVRHTGKRRGCQGSPHRKSYRASTSLGRRWIYLFHQLSKPGHGTEGGSAFFRRP